MTIIEDAVRDNQVLLVLVDKAGYAEKCKILLRSALREKKPLCYTTFNRPSSSIRSAAEKMGIDSGSLLFIDTVTRSIEKPVPDERCIFVSSPQALTEISIAASKMMKDKGCLMMIFDSLSALLIYEKPNAIIQFTHSIISKARLQSANAIFLALKEDTDSELLKDLYMFVDKVVEA